MRYSQEHRASRSTVSERERVRAIMYISIRTLTISSIYLFYIEVNNIKLFSNSFIKEVVG